MPITKTKINYSLDLTSQLADLTNKEKNRAKKRIAKFVLDEIEADTIGQVSPVTGSNFKPLSKEYKAIKKSAGAGGKADLHLSGGMVNSIRTLIKQNDSIEFFVTDSEQKKKVFNHTVGDTLPKRPLLPNDELGKSKFGTFNSDIREGIRQIVKEVKGGN